MTQTDQPIPTDKKPRAIPGRIGAVLRVIAGLVAYARHFATNATTLETVPEFVTAAAVLGTHDIPTILYRMKRGMLRALALRDYLLARAARGHNLHFIRKPYLDLLPHHRPPAKPPRAPRTEPRKPSRPEPAVLDLDHPDAFRMPTPEEFAAEMRRRPVGRSIVFICMDLGIAPGLCGGDLWMRIYNICLLYTSPSPRDGLLSRMPSSA